MRNRRPPRRNSQGLFGGWTGIGRKTNRGPLTRAPRRRDIELLEPRQMLTTVGTPTDEPFFAFQWNLDATGQNVEFNASSPTFDQTLADTDINVIPAWELGFTGSGIQVAIVDGGFDLTHEDLVFLPGFDLLGLDDDPTFDDVTDATGTAIAGVIGARDNGIGTIGIAYESDLIPIRLNPGVADLGDPSIDAINASFRAQAGMILDLDGDGTPDSVTGGPLVPVDIDGDGTIDGLGELPSNVTDVFYHSGEFLTPVTGELTDPRIVSLLPTGPSTTLLGDDGLPLQISILQAIEETATGGRAVWDDANGDGVFSQDEVVALGAIHVVPAGNDAGISAANQPFTPDGFYATSQYDQLANSPYTIAVGGVTYDGRFENNATGTVNGIYEGGANVLIVAPTGTNGIDIATLTEIDAGVVTTDPTGNFGANLAGLPNFEFDGDYFADTNYTSTATGSEIAAAQTAGVIALMLEANPNLSQRDVQQILLMSAETTDQFSETWITNQVQTFFDIFIEPDYATYDLDTNGDGEADIEDAILPNFQSPVLNRGFFFNNPDMSLGVPYVFDPELFDPSANLPDPPERLNNGLLNFSGLLIEGDPPEGDLDIDGDVDEDDLAILVMNLGIMDPTPEQGDLDEDGDIDEDDQMALEMNLGMMADIGFLTIVGSNVPPIPNPDPITGDPLIGPDGFPIVDPEVTEFFSPAPVIVFAEGTVPDFAPGAFFFQNPLNSPVTPLEFENGAGFTVSHGYGSNLEDIGYAHGLLNAELAVELALAWEANDLYLSDEIVITSDTFGVPGQVNRVQPRTFVVQDNASLLEVPGGLSVLNINTGFYEEFFLDFETEEIEGMGNPNFGETMDTVFTGEVITDAPFFDPDGNEDLSSNRGANLIPFQFDPSVETDFLSVEWITVTTTITGGDPDHLRVAIQAPDGTQTELNPFRPQVNQFFGPIQTPQGQQGYGSPSEEAISAEFGPISLDPDQVISGTGDGSEIGQFDAAAGNEQVPDGQGYTWTTNRHWGELISLQANSFADIGPDGGAGVFSSDQWFLVVENHGDTAVFIGDEYEIAIHGTEATGNRIQGKIGLDDNALGIDGVDGDENFNFNRFVEFAELQLLVDTGEVEIDPDTGDEIAITTTITQNVVLDEAFDSVTYTNSQASPAGDPELTGSELDMIYRTVAPETGVEILYPVVDRDEYFNIDLAALTPSLDNYLQTTIDPDFTVIGIGYNTQTLTNPDPADGLFIETPLSYRNFDYSQETFAAGVTVVATQFEVQYDTAGNIVGRTATGVVDKFTTGADGNYYFDVEANPEPPVPGTPAYDAWFVEFGTLFEYEISLEGVDTGRILTNEDGGGIGYFDFPASGLVDFDTTTLSYTVAINDADPFQIVGNEEAVNGLTTKTENVNFLLTQDPAETAGTATGQVFTDFNNDGLFNGADEAVAGVTVFVDLDLSGDVTVGDITGVTDVNGNYALVVPNVTDGQVVTVSVVESTLPDDREFLSPATGSQTVTLAQGASSFASFTLNPEGVLPGQSAVISGEVFEDLDGDGISDPGEPPLTPIRVFIDSNGNGVFDDDLDGNPATTDAEISAITTATGAFTLSLPTGGVFDVMVDFGFGEAFAFTQTTPAAGAPITVSVASGGAASGLLFGLTDLRTQDFGDLGGPYPTLAADDGPRHELVPSVFLGSVAPDAELDGQPTSTANGDNTNGANDEDGVTLLTPLVQGGVIVDTLEFDILANGQNAVLNGWIDFDNSGSFEADEQIFTDTSLVSGTTNRVSAAVPSDTVIASSYAARFRWGPFGLGPTGAANAGEVEDYVFPASGTTPLGSTDGDYNSDGTVDQGDELTWQSDFGATSGDALRSDGNGDGVVNLFDYIFWREAYESQPPTLADPPATGDYNGDGSVDGDDHTAFADAHGSTVDPGTGADGNGDGAVNAADFVVWREAEASQSAAVSLLSDPGPETTPAVASMSVFVDALAVVTPQAVAVAPVVDSALEVTAPAEDAEADSDAVDLALLQLAAGDAVVEDDEAAADATPLAEEDEGESIELALDEGLLVAI